MVNFADKRQKNIKQKPANFRETWPTKNFVATLQCATGLQTLRDSAEIFIDFSGVWRKPLDCQRILNTSKGMTTCRL